MLKAIDIANFFIDLAIHDPNDAMTNMRVNKLVYFAQGHSLARNREPLFNEKIEAWDYGPVTRSVYDAFKPCGNNKIEYVSGDYSSTLFSIEQMELLLDVMREYGQYSTSKLVDLSHSQDSPWERVFKPHEDNEISQKSMQEYFSKYPLKHFQLPDVSADDCVGYTGEDGLTVLPAEYDYA